MFCNPVSEGADPWIIRHGGQYLWCHSDNATKIFISACSELQGPYGQANCVFQVPQDGPCSGEVWAPELHFIDGRFYIYFAASDGDNATHLAYVLRAETNDPMGPYSLHGPLATGDGPDGPVWAIDMTVLQVGGRRYAIWSGWDAPGTDNQYLYIAPMRDPLTLAGPRVRICDNATHVWERTEDNMESRGLNEGPQVLQHAGRTFVTYSCAASWLPTYKLGLLELVGPNPLDPSSWVKDSKPLFRSSSSTYGVGHGCFVQSPDASEWWHVYHAKADPLPGWDRNVFMQRFSFRQDGKPSLGSPVKPGAPLEVPSGSCRASGFQKQHSLGGA